MSLRVLVMSLWNVQKDHVMTAIPGMLYGHQIHIVVWRFWGSTKVVINWMNGVWEVKGEEHAVPVRGVVDQFVLGGFSGRELMRMIGVGIFSCIEQSCGT